MIKKKRERECANAIEGNDVSKEKTISSFHGVINNEITKFKPLKEYVRSILVNLFDLFHFVKTFIHH